MIENDKAKMIFGGSSSAVAISGGYAAKARDTLYFGTLTYSNTTTGADGHTHMFRESYNAWMSAKLISKHIKKAHKGKELFFLTADYTWGWSTENSIRKFSNTKDKDKHGRALVPFPGASDSEFKEALEVAQSKAPDVLVLVLFGNDMAKALKMAAEMGLREKMEIIVPNLTLGMAQSAGPEAMEGVVGAVPWTWNIPYEFGFEAGKKFVEAFAKRYDAYPSSSAASAYSILYQYKEAVERAGSFDTVKVQKALEGHKYTLLKDEQEWRKFDHQNIQTVYAVRGKSKEAILQDKFQSDYFEVLTSMNGKKAARNERQWKNDRFKANKSSVLN
jgi:ABC-type branched-subunit amino acid transport system substrate-binding protein